MIQPEGPHERFHEQRDQRGTEHQQHIDFAQQAMPLTAFGRQQKIGTQGKSGQNACEMQVGQLQVAHDRVSRAKAGTREQHADNNARVFSVPEIIFLNR